MKLNGLTISGGEFKLINPLTDIFYEERSIVLTREEAIEKGLGNQFKNKHTRLDNFLNLGRRVIGYIKIDGLRVPIFLEKEN